MAGSLVEYQSSAGFKGPDTFIYDAFLVTGGVVHTSVTVNVQ